MEETPFEETWEGREKQENEEFFRLFSKHVNRMGRNDDSVVKAMANDHRTLQQNYMRFFMAFCKEMAKQEYSDLRNEASVELAKKILPLNKGLPFV